MVEPIAFILSTLLEHTLPCNELQLQGINNSFECTSNHVRTRQSALVTILTVPETDENENDNRRKPTIHDNGFCELIFKIDD